MIGDFVIRAYRADDVEAITDVWNQHQELIGSDSRLTPELMAGFMNTPTYNAEQNAFIVEDAGGRVIGFCDIDYVPETGRTWSDAVLLPEHRGRGIEAHLFRLVEDRVFERARAEGTPPHVPIHVNRVTTAHDNYTIDLLREDGYFHVRSSYRMMIDLRDEIDVPPLPEGVELRPFNLEQHAHAVYEAVVEAFVDHWGFHRDPFEVWKHYMLERPDQDISMWLIAWDGDQIAGVALNRPFGEHEPDKAYVQTLGVRKPWRKQGLGFALLKHSFKLFQDRGFARAGLGVDAANTTNAVALYERAGMHVDLQFVTYRKMLRGNAEDAIG